MKLQTVKKYLLQIKIIILSQISLTKTMIKDLKVEKIHLMLE